MESEKKQKSERKQLTESQRDGRTLALLGLELAGLIVAAVTVGLIAGSCGEKQEQVASSTPSVVEASDGGTATVASHMPVTPSDDPVVASADSLPPEVAAFVSDSLVAPGAAVEITAQASVDATELTLKDGIGKRQSFTYDENGKLWRAYYRAPLKSVDRLGLSVTAKNEAGRWQRVWVFLKVGHPMVSTPGDSVVTEK